MTTSLDRLIVQHRDRLVDQITKDAIRQIPSYGNAPLRQTIERVEQFLQVLVKSIAQNDPDILEQHLVAVASERRAEGYALMELHSIVYLTEERVLGLIERSTIEGIDRNALTALLQAVMGAARMVLTVRYMLVSGNGLGPVST
jgi:hypothetical protein